MDILMVGFNSSIFKSLEEEKSNFKITVIEEPELFQKKNLKRHNFENLEEFLLAEYQQSNELINKVKQHIDETDKNYIAVYPGLEYAVSATVELARFLGLPNSGLDNNELLSNKLMFRNHCDKYDIPQPKFLEVSEQKDIEKFFSNINSNEMVLKPSNRQASLGVIKITNKEQIPESWNEVLNIDEGNQLVTRSLDFNYLVEECIHGEEMSAEVFIKEGKILFTNFTDKEITNGKYSVELGHVIPSLKNNNLLHRVSKIIEVLSNSLDFHTGVLHVEFIINEQDIKVIECAGRAPGDKIFNLIKLAYGFDPYLALLNILSGRKVDFPINSNNGAVIKFFNPKPGRVTSIQNKEVLESNDIHEGVLNIEEGSEIEELRSSWNRVGHIIKVSENAASAKKQVEELMNKITISTS